MRIPYTLIHGRRVDICDSLLGVTLHQAYRYARLFPNDSPWLKGLVCKTPASHKNVTYLLAEQVALAM